MVHLQIFTTADHRLLFAFFVWSEIMTAMLLLLLLLHCLNRKNSAAHEEIMNITVVIKIQVDQES